MFSKETIDRVKLAKQYIENRYQSMISQECKDKQNWNKIMKLIDPASQNAAEVVQDIVKSQMINKRLQRSKDNLSNYKLYNVIGRGAFGEVRLGRNIATNEIVAIKRLEKKYILEKKQIYNTYLQRDLMAKNNGQFIVQIKSSFQDGDYLYFTMQYVQGGDLLHLLIEKDTLSENQTKFYIAEMILAVEQIHKMNYIHRDIKPDNILIDKSGHIKISDFGLSKYLQLDSKLPKSTHNMKLSKMQKLKKLTQIKNKQKSFSKVGTPDYISPQVLIQKTYNHLVDLWGIGVIMFQCLYGYPPFTDENSKQVCHKVANWVDYLEFPTDTETSTAAKMLILGLLNEKTKRLTIKQVKKHPWFQNFDWQNIRKMRPPFIPKIKDEIDVSNFDEFQLKNPWTEDERRFISKFIKKSKSLNKSQARQSEEGQIQLSIDNIQPRATVGPKFHFAGFDYRKLNQDPLQYVATKLERKSCTLKSIKKGPPMSRAGSAKQIRTQNSSSKKKLLKPKKSLGKQRPSQFLHTSTTNNTSSSFLLRRFSVSKQILKTAYNDEVFDRIKLQQKQNLNRTHTREVHQVDSNPALKKKLIKAKVEKIKQIYGAQAQKIKLKKIVSIQCHKNA